MSRWTQLNPVYLYRKRDKIVPRLAAAVRAGGRTVGVPLGANDRRLLALKDKHRGRRAFLVGNGPSLRIPDLDRLTGEITFACNKIYLAFDQTPWRPTYYGAEDRLVLDNPDTVPVLRRLADGGSTILVPHYSPRFPDPEVRPIVYPHRYEDRYPAPPPFGTNPFRAVYGGNTVMYIMLQFALYMGVREVYLIGVDADYRTPEKMVTAGDGVHSLYEVAGEKNHFHPDYLKSGELMYSPNVHRHETSYLAAKAAYEAAGGTIINATRGGKLELFPRADFDAVAPPPLPPPESLGAADADR